MFLLQCGVGIVLALAMAMIGLAMKWNLSSASLLYLLLVVAFAVHCGFWQASVISVSAIFCQGYFFAPPAFSFYIADPSNGIAIVVFEITALLVSRVSSREKLHGIEMERQRRRTQRLYAVSRGALLLNLQDSPERQMARLIRSEFQVEAVAVINSLLGTVGIAGNWAGMPEDEDLDFDSIEEEFGGGLSRTLTNSEGGIGRLLVKGEIPEFAMDSLASLVTLTLERHRAFINEGVAEAARQTEQLRTTVLDGLAHAFKTPLTIIRAASSGLIELGHLDDLQSQLTLMIDEQSMRLDEMANRLLRTARVEGEKMCLELETVDLRALIDEVVEDFREEWSDGASAGVSLPAIEVAAHGPMLRIAADHDMLATTLRELLENAAKYSAPGSAIDISATENDVEVTLSVHSRGNVIGLEDRERIFERFYRGKDHQHSAPGTGIGLSVVRRVAEAHGGHIWVVSNEQDGTTFHVSLPRKQAMA